MVTNTNRGEILLLNRLGSFFGILGVLAILRDVVVVVGVAIDAGCVRVEVYIGRGGGYDARLRTRVDGRTVQENLKRKGFTIDEQGRAHIKVKGVDDSSYIDKTQRYGLLSLHHISPTYASYIMGVG